jgi:hypothetical protein
MKHDLDNKTKVELIRNFVNIEDFSLKNYNVGAEKNYAEMYKKVKSLPLPEWYVEKMLNTKYVNHFYSKEKNLIKEKWLKQGRINL